MNDAKCQIFGPVDIDQLAIPSEILVMADEADDAATLSTDLLAQAEHNVRSRVGAISRELAEAMLREVGQQLKSLPTADVAGPA